VTSTDRSVDRAADRVVDPATAVVAIGGSAGAVESLIELVGGLPADLSAAVLVTVHIREDARSRLPAILTRSGPLVARHAEHGDLLADGVILVAPPGRHLLVAGNRVLLGTGPRVNHVRPAIDPMLGSLSADRILPTIGVILSGLLDDGAVGLALLEHAGGTVVVEDPETAIFPSMPRAALAAVPSALLARAADLATAVVRSLAGHAWQHVPAEQEAPMTRMGDSDDPAFLSPEETALTRMTCPECSGSLAEVRLPRITYYRCHVGHQYSPQTLAAAQAESAEAKLWTAVAALEEQAVLARHLADHPDIDPSAAAANTVTADRAAGLAALLRERLQPADGRPAVQAADQL
jgi:two-component system, chemotaxis family, protein-glutamate methylesterase/glutaminase